MTRKRLMGRPDSPMQTTWIRWVFGISAAYDGFLGLAFLIASKRVFEFFGVTPPNHYGYVQFPALLLVIFALMFAHIAIDPNRRRDWIPYGAGLKAAYCGVAFHHFFFGSIPSMWMPFAYADLAFLALFIVAWFNLIGQSSRRLSASAVGGVQSVS